MIYTQNEQQLKAVRFLLYMGTKVRTSNDTVAGDTVYRITLKNGERIDVDDIDVTDMMIDNQDSIRERKRVLSFTSHGQLHSFIGKDIDVIDVLNRQPVVN